MSSAVAPTQVVLVVDFGAQYAPLIARRVRELNVYSEIVSHTISAAEVAERRPAAMILSGGPKSVHVDGARVANAIAALRLQDTYPSFIGVVGKPGALGLDVCHAIK